MNTTAYMSLIDWLILVIPVVFVLGMGIFARRYVRGVSDFLTCGRLCGRYVLNIGDVTNALSVIGLVAFIEMKYKTGFALGFWTAVLSPLTLLIALTGFVGYRWRETRAMSLGQFLEMRYSRKFRIFAAGLRSLAEILANMIMPAIAARFFIQMLNLPQTLSLCGLSIPTFDFLMLLFLTLAISLICLGGTLSLVITATIQGMILYPLILCFIVFILHKFSWGQEIIPVLTDRVPGESFLNPMDIGNLRDFNIFTMVIVVAFNSVFHAATWIGIGTSGAAKSAHEQKMSSILGAWSIMIINVFYLLIAVCLITFLNHKNFAKEASQVRHTLANRVAEEVVKDADTRARLTQAIAEIPPQVHEVGVDPPLSQEENLDSEFLGHIHTILKEDARERTTARLVTENGGTDLTAEQLASKPVKDALVDAEGKANDTFQQCRTLFHQLNLSVTMRALLPVGLFGAFCLLLFLAMLSTDDTRIFSATLTIAQDCILPFFPKGLSPKRHIWMIRFVAIGIGIFFFFGSKYMAQLDYVQLFNQMAVAIWNAGCCPVMIFGLYWKKGTTKAAWTAIIVGIILSVSYILIQRNWADYVYPFLVKANLDGFVDKCLRLASAPYGDLIVWKMDPIKFPINAIEFLFFANIFDILLYIVVALCTCKEDFNMDRLLHRGKYAEPGKLLPAKKDWSPKGILKQMIGITPEYSKGDKVIAYSLFFYSFVYGFILAFVGVAIWNCFSPWKIEYWSTYFLITSVAVPALTALVTMVWYGIGGAIGLVGLFRELEKRRHEKVNVLDDGRVEGNVSLADKANDEK